MTQPALPALLRRICLGATSIALGAAALVAPATASTADSDPARPTASSSDIRLDPAGDHEPVSRRADAQLAELTSGLPSDWEARLASFDAATGVDRTAVGSARAAIDPAGYVCGPTRLDQVVATLVRNADPVTLETLGKLGVLSYPTYDAVIYGTGKGRYRLQGTQGRTIVRTFGKLKRFWDIRGGRIRLMSTDRSMLMDKKRVARVAAAAFGVKKKKSLRFARAVIALIKSDPVLREGRNPIFSLNAVAVDARGKSSLARRIGKRIVFGTGILKVYRKLGYVKIAGQALVAHEYAHHVQLARGLVARTITKPEKNRRSELMADSFATYFLGHRKGLRLRTQKLKRDQAVDIASLVGDCAFDDPTHHGTPRQRAAAARYGFKLAKQSQAKVRKSRWLAKRFDRKLPALVAPDAAPPLTP
ncbi:MAG: hypothetical protein ACRCYQ_06780 [Nocardioides sp.]